MNQSNVQIVGLGVDRHNPDVPALAVMNEILGGGFGSRLFPKVRTKLGLAYAVGGGFGFAYDHPGAFQRRSAHQERHPRSTPPRPPWPKSPDSTPSPSPRKNSSAPRTTSSTPSSSTTTPATRSWPSAKRLEFYGYPADYLETYHAALEKVTLADLAAVAKKYIHPGTTRRPGRRQRAGNQAGARRAQYGLAPAHRHYHSAPRGPAGSRRRGRKITLRPLTGSGIPA